MTAVNSRGEEKTSTGRPRRRALSVLAAAGACTVILTGVAPAAVAEDAQQKEWHLDAMQMDKVWEKSTGKGVKVAVIDSGVNKSTPSLRGQVLPGKDFSGSAGGVNDDPSGHGTTMSEFVAGTGASGGLKGVAPGAKVIPFKVNLGDVGGDDQKDRFGEAIRAAADSDAKIISMSFGGAAPSPAMEEGLKYAQKKGKLLFASAGNEAKKGNGSHYPAQYPEAIGVGSTNKAGSVSDYSSNGAQVDLSAPGSDLPVHCGKDQKNYCGGDGGTSAATAITSGTAALLWSKHPDWTANQVLRVMFDTAGRAAKDDKNVSKYIGRGEVRPRINLVEGKGEPGDPAINPLTDKPAGPAAKDSKNPSGSSQSGADSEKAGAKDKAELSDSKSESNSRTWIIGGAAAVAIVVVGGGAIMAVRKKRG
ncbi:S8 family serine peptidase [Streptomyces sp. ODS28]|uniref:S8 family serine peptidase n=1 Tax=Streptomyces sp. ODS28 TaxID=3136688 RepID=UPI0031F12133